MPYIKKEQRERVLSEKVFEGCGDLNFAINDLISEYIDQHKFCYQTCNDVVGALECAKLEIYRRLVAPYEDEKILENGDAPPYDQINSFKTKKY